MKKEIKNNHQGEIKMKKVKRLPNEESYILQAWKDG